MERYALRAAMEDPARIRNHLFCLGLDVLCDSRRRARSSSAAFRRHAIRGCRTAGLSVGRQRRKSGSPRRASGSRRSLLAFLIFVVDYGILFWAEQRVPSGIAAVILATIPAFMALSEIVILRTRRLTARLSVALLSGIAGVAVLMSHSINLGKLGKLGGAPIDTAGAVGLIIGAISWSIASALARKLPLPSSKVMSSGAQMLAGGVMLRGRFLPRSANGADSICASYRAQRGSRSSIWFLPAPSRDSRPTCGCCITNRRPRWEPMRTSILWWL